MSNFVPIYDLESLTEPQRIQYVKDVCAHIGVPDNLNLVMLGYLDDRTGPRRLVAFVKRGATEIIRANKGINIISCEPKEIRGSIVFTAIGKDGNGRQEVASGSKFIANLQGVELDDAIMTADTRAKQRLTLQYVGAGVLDESEVNPKEAVQLKNTTPMVVEPAPIVAPTSAPGKDVTEAEKQFETLKGISEVAKELKPEDYTIGTTKAAPEVQAAFEKQQADIRQAAIDQLNAKAQAEAPAPKPRKKRAVKAAFEQVPAPALVAPVAEPQAAPPPVPAAIEQPAPVATPPAAVQVAPPAPVAKRLSVEEIKPFRQRQFKLITELELAGFAPKEGKGNLDKMKDFVSMMFPEVQNFNDLTIVQWETYLNKIEGKLKAEGAAATISYIEQTIGV